MRRGVDCELRRMQVDTELNVFVRVDECSFLIEVCVSVSWTWGFMGDFRG